MPDLHRPSSRYLREEIDEAVRQGETLGAIECEIVDEAAVGSDARAALWLYAWGAVERRRSGRPLVTVSAMAGADTIR